MAACGNSDDLRRILREIYKIEFDAKSMQILAIAASFWKPFNCLKLLRRFGPVSIGGEGGF